MTDIQTSIARIQGETAKLPWARAVLDETQQKAHFWKTHFSDSPDLVSGWFHNYFCTKCNSRLEFDISSPREHRCPQCGTVNTEEKHNQAWVGIYRSKLSSDLVHIALLSRVQPKPEWRQLVIDVVASYARSYDRFPVHGTWVAKGKIMPQALTEAVFGMSLLEAIELLSPKPSATHLQLFRTRLFEPLSQFIMSQPEHLPNIRLWIFCAAASTGAVFQNEDLLFSAIYGPGGIKNLLEQYVTDDHFWLEGSMNYHFYALRSVTRFLHIAKLQGYEFPEMLDTVRSMYEKPMELAYRDLRLPNPSDTWANVGLFTFVHQYEMAANLFEAPNFHALTQEIYRRDLREPNLNSLRYPTRGPGEFALPRKSVHLPSLNFVLLRSAGRAVFFKYGFAVKGHAHFDRCTVEIEGLSHDPANIEYGSPMHAEWYQTTVAHNTVVVDGQNQDEFAPGRLYRYEPENGLVEGGHPSAYPGVAYRRRLRAEGNQLTDEFILESDDEHVYDWLFYAAGSLVTEERAETEQPAEASESSEAEDALGYSTNGYQHLHEVTPIRATGVRWVSAATEDAESRSAASLELDLSAFDGEAYRVRAPGTPPSERRYGVLLRKRAASYTFSLRFRWSD